MRFSAPVKKPGWDHSPSSSLPLVCVVRSGCARPLGAGAARGPGAGGGGGLPWEGGGGVGARDPRAYIATLHRYAYDSICHFQLALEVGFPIRLSQA